MERTDPEWRQEMRRCRLCREEGLIHFETRYTWPSVHQDSPVLHNGKKGHWAFPLFLEEANIKASVLFVVEAPNWTDTCKGRLTIDPCTDESGRFFHEMLTRILGLRPEQIYLTNTVLCLPARKDGGYPVTAKLRNNCLPNLKTTLDSVAPRVVVPQGAKALEALGYIRCHGLELRTAAGRPHTPWYKDMILFPVYHPSLKARRHRPKEQQEEDYRRLRRLLEEEGLVT